MGDCEIYSREGFVTEFISHSIEITKCYGLSNSIFSMFSFALLTFFIAFS